MAKRLTKQHLETDPLLTSYYIFTSFLKRNLVLVITGTVLFFLLAGGGVFYYFHSQNLEDRASEHLVMAEAAFHRGDFEAALYGDNERITVGLQEIIANYGRTKAGNLARYYAAVAEAEIGNFEEALSYIERFRPPSGILGVGPISFHAVLLANLQEYERATQTFLKAAEWDKNESTTPQNLLYAALTSIEAKNNALASELVNQIIEKYRDSEVADEALQIKGMLAIQ